MPSLAQLSSFLRDAIQRHGGGMTGIRSLATRSVKVVRALGIRGLLWRLRAAQQRNSALPPPEAMTLNAAAPLASVNMSIGVMAHVFYPDLLEELAGCLARIPLPYTLMVSVVDESARAQAEARLSALPRLSALHVRIVPNRGRDIAPLLVTFREEILALDLICHVHTKKSLYGGQDQVGWRGHLFDSLLGSSERQSWIFGMFQANPELGIVYPESYANVPLWGHTWLSNAEWGRQLAEQLGFEIDAAGYLDFPAGSMFWARTQALRPLFELGLRTDSFPPEKGQIDGTLQHAIERMLSLVTRHQGMFVGILPTDGRLALAQEGERNRRLYFDAPLRQKIDYFATDATWLSFDIFDTLVLRPFLTAQGARDFLAMLVHKQHGIENFGALRTQAEAKARARAGKDVDLDRIYATLHEDAALPADTLAAVKSLELATERRLLKPRHALVAALESFAAEPQRKLLGVSDMYITEAELRSVLPAEVDRSLSRLYVSCDTGWRKDSDAGWRALLDAEHAEARRWLHIGDNEQADVMRPLHAGLLFPVHVLRPAAYLDVVPGLRSLRPSPEQRGHWSHELWLGLVANRLAQVGDQQPLAFAQAVQIEHPDTFGYTVLGPLLADYLLWLARTALQHGTKKILFLSREGYLLHRLYQRLQEHVPALADVDGRYLLVSRRGVNTPAVRSLADLAPVFRKPYTGTLFGLLDSRLGRDVAVAARETLGKAALDSEVYLPEMAEALIDRLRPAASMLENIAERERSAYLAYWKTHVREGDRPILADVGYVGSIQAQLARVTGEALGGAYFAVTREIGEVLAGNQWAAARFHDGREQVESSPVLEQHLLLESMLTSPSGQFSHFEQDGAELVARYREDEAHGHRWTIIGKVQAGAEQFIADLLDVVGEHALEIHVSSLAVQEPLRSVGSGRWQLGAWSEALSVDDGYTGRGQVTTRPATR
ncbi:rhamnan synthesis F family protein [Dyella kyungheensis]|uniref:Polysaccharide biosynthesis protein n=1 Tax=Dyella kyungheensis TaxID=1242174 RepID=A0ABS2JRK2_9GAMM|nr:rhamnan synthesis F family protein [Dyella kyungheensis]MBM7121652.1 polysaccharide biosynthesis protein [Dyella kyungheensis]